MKNAVTLASCALDIGFGAMSDVSVADTFASSRTIFDSGALSFL